MGSKSDAEIIRGAVKTLDIFGVPMTVRVLSAHRTPKEAAAFAESARSSGYGALICAAGKAAHLAGIIAANTTLPVIGIPVMGSAFDGLDSLLSTVQMPAGVPVAAVAVNGAENAALLAVQMLAIEDGALALRLEKYKREMAEKVLADDSEIMSAFKLN